MKIVSTFLIAFIILSGCRKHPDKNPCAGLTLPVAEFSIRETVGDTTFSADTIFRDNYVEFKSLSQYQSVLWKIGNDPRDFNSADFNLSFNNFLGSLLVSFTGKKIPNTLCFPNDNGEYKGTKNITLVEQLDKSTLTISPLVGKYKGYFTDNPSDMWTVRIDYFDSTKYDVSTTGSKNFYWISNIPKAFIDSTSESARQYPELRNGIRLDMGYKSFVFQYNTCITGKGWLQNDTLYVNYGNNFCGRRQFIGKRL
jgi:hypothetical protein